MVSLSDHCVENPRFACHAFSFPDTRAVYTHTLPHYHADDDCGEGYDASLLIFSSYTPIIRHLKHFHSTRWPFSAFGQGLIW